MKDKENKHNCFYCEKRRNLTCILDVNFEDFGDKEEEQTKGYGSGCNSYVLRLTERKTFVFR